MSLPPTRPSNLLQPQPPRFGIVALVSGGLDSAVMLGLALEAGETVWPLYVRQGFVWEDEEVRALERFLDSLVSISSGRLNPLTQTALTAPYVGSVAWATEVAADFPGAETPDEAVYLPGRNLALLTQASILAHSKSVARIQLGVLAANPFPDATSEFFQAFEAAAYQAMRNKITIERPLAAMHKSEVLRRGAKFDLGLTLSCLRPMGGVHCGRCNKCAERRRAFREAGVSDPSRYAGE